VTMTETLWMVEASVRRASAPEVSSRGPEAAAGIVAASARSVLVIGGAAGVVLFAFAPQLIGLLYGPAFLGAVLPLRILLPGAILYGAARNLLQYHQFQLARPQVVSALSAAAALASIAAYLTLIPGHGVAGAALASALVYTSVFVVALVLFCRRTGLSPAQVVIPTGADVRALGEMLRRRPPSSPPSTPVDAAAPAALDAAAAKDTQDTPDASAPDGVLVLTSSYPSAMAPHNGVFVREHSLALAEEGPCVTIVAPRIFREDPAYSHDGLLHVRRFGFLSGRRLLSEYRRVPVLRMATYVVSGLFSTLAVARARRPCVIQAHWIVPAGVIGVAAGKLLGVPVVITAHGSDVRMATDGPWPVRLLARRALINADHVIAVSQAIRQVLVTRLGVAPQRVAVVPMGVDQRLFKPGGRAAARLTLGVPAEAGVVLFVGALTQLKGVSELVEAMPSVVAASPEARLYVAGAGPLDDDVRRRTGELGLDGKVTLLGDVAHDEIARWMNAADVLVLPSRREGLPVCLMEAAAVGLPVVATDAGGSAEIVVLDPRSVLLPLAGPAGGADPSALAAAVESALLARQPDMRQPAFEPGSPYSLTGAIRLITGIYEGLRDTRKAC
jgi:teichuronic acid biosynthesis glycosyltransferase TuaC